MALTSSLTYSSIFLLFVIIIELQSAEVHSHRFTYEAVTPQKIITGCRGTEFPETKEIQQSFYIIDATGTRKTVEPDTTVEVVFPFPVDSSYTQPHRRQLVRFIEICFPSQCRAPSCGFTVGPLPLITLPHQGGGKTTFFIANSCQNK